ncbi:efflux RND transporter periplasmic adaptor subunit [Paracoccus onubensis]|uniref:Efflux RND transporter periplasmic adaptor subunit n=1 Tax=Paracoccus onubensis TaxID=1675788 RepID=A0A418SLP3_9RHOB|nr:efflux RND transporter periplasmic adaptor subunit [Paracoccus onubensis]RJE81871.1 efflux RND transporter periplasmic adaptor subunit [Paracoccus onubensis]
MRALKVILGVLVILAAAAGGLYVTDRLMAAPNLAVAQGPESSSSPLTVETIPVGTGNFRDTVRAVGTARARNAVNLVAETGGRITHIGFRPGQSVAKGDVLLTLDDRAEQADVKAAEATLAEADTAFTRQQQLNKTGSASDAAYQTAKAALLRAEAELDRARVILDDRRVRAPFSGVVGLTDLVEGQVVDATTTVTTLDDRSLIEVDFSVPEIQLSRLEPGLRIEVTTAAWPGRVFEGKVSRIDTRVDSATRSIALRGEIPNDDRALTGGMFLQVDLVLAERQQIAIPEQVLTVEGDRHLVLVARDGVAKQAEISVGQQVDGLVEVVSGLSQDEQIIVTNLHRVAPGMEIDVVARAADAPATAGIDG